MLLTYLCWYYLQDNVMQEKYAYTVYGSRIVLQTKKRKHNGGDR